MSRLKFCDYWGYERASAFHVMREEYGYPVLSIDRPYASRFFRTDKNKNTGIC